MKAASTKDIKAELGSLSHKQLLEIIMNLSRYKKENKELLTYLLFKAHDEISYINEIKAFIEEEFNALNRTNLYFTKKNIRKILRYTNKFIKYSSHKQTEVELLIFFCGKMKNADLPLLTNTALGNIYQRQIQKIASAIKQLHEDLQYDFNTELRPLLLADSDNL